MAELCLLGRQILLHYVEILCQEMFQQLDKEDDGIIYVRDVIFYLKAMNDDMENKKVNIC